MSDIKIKIENLYKVFGKNPKSVMPLVRDGIGKDELLEKHGHVLGLEDINMDLDAHSIDVVMGLSGSGKSTLIRHINRLIEPTEGRVIVDGEDVLAMNKNQLREFRRAKTSMVFQKFALLPHHTVIENTAFGLLVQGVSEPEAKKRAEKWLDRVGLGGFEHHYPAQLSGGMQQRVGLARALTTDADIMLMDEAYSALDPLIRTDMQDLLLELQQELNKTVVFITHDLDEALKLGDRIAILKDGKLVQQGIAQEILLTPADDYVRDFVADVNRVKVLKARALVETADQIDRATLKTERTIEVRGNETVDNIINQLLNSDAELVVVKSRDGNSLGYITPAKLSTAVGTNLEEAA